MMFLEKPDDFNAKIEVVSCFLEHDGKILLLHRQDHKAQGGTWGVPGGKAGEGELLADAMIREMHEETGFAVSSVKYCSTVFVRFPDFDFVYHIFHHVLENSIDVRINPHEHKAYMWVTPQAALSMNLIQDQDACTRLFYAL